MDVVLLGATGFVGRAVLDELLATPWVRSVRVLLRNPSALKPLTHAKLVIIEGSLADFPSELLPKDEPYSIIHFASVQRSADPSVLAVNQAGLDMIFVRAGANLKGMVFGSSMSVNGQGHQRGVDGSAPGRPETALAVSRFACEEIVRQNCSQRGIGFANLRPRFILDVNDPSTLGPWIKLARKGILLGNGEQKFSIIERRDYARVTVQLAASFQDGECYVQGALVVGYSTPLVYGEIWRSIRRELGLRERPRIRIPANPALLSLMHRFRSLAGTAVKLELMGFDHYGDSRALKPFVSHALIEQNPHAVALRLVKASLVDKTLEKEIV